MTLIRMDSDSRQSGIAVNATLPSVTGTGLSGELSDKVMPLQNEKGRTLKEGKQD
jgi:hypothetical protein